MTRPHLHSRHTHGGLLSLDRYAQASRLSMVSPRLKAAFAVAVLLLCVAADSAAIGLVISAGMLAACIGCRRRAPCATSCRSWPSRSPSS